MQSTSKKTHISALAYRWFSNAQLFPLHKARPDASI